MGLFRNLFSCIRCDPEDPTRLPKTRSATPTVNAAGAPNNGDDGGSARYGASDSVPITGPAQLLQDDVLQVPCVRSDSGHPTGFLQRRSATPTMNAARGSNNGDDEGPARNEASGSVSIAGSAQLLSEGSTTPSEGGVYNMNSGDDKDSTKNDANDCVKADANQHSEDSGRVWKDIAGTGLAFLDPVVEVSGIFPPLKIMAVGLRIIFEHAETAQGNKQISRDLATRIEEVLQSLNNSPNDPDVVDGCQRLSEKLKNVTSKLSPIRGILEDDRLRDKFIRFVKAPGNAEIVQDCIKIVNNALMDYQLWMTRRIFAIVWQQSKSEEIRLTAEQAKAVQGVKDAAHDLEVRIEGIMQVLESSPNDPDVASKCQNLSKELSRITDILSSMGDLSTLQDRCARLATLPENAKTLRDCVTIVDNALMQYQLSMTQRVCGIILQQLKSEERSALYKIKRADQASFYAEDRPKCLEGTRKEVLNALQDWALSESGPQIFWLNGPAGSGKSTIAQTFAYWLHSKDKLGASFFCSRNSEARRDLKMIFPTISFQLATSTNPASSKFRDALLRALEANPDGASLSLQNQFSSLMVHPAGVSTLKTVIIIDALDECNDDSTTSTLLSLLDDHLVGVNSLKFFITSRPENNIQLGFKYTKLSLRSDKKSLNDVPTTVIDKDIRRFLDTQLRQLSTNRPYLHLPADWPSKEVLDALTRKSAGLFIYASTVLKIVDDPNSDPRDHLDNVVASPDDYRLEGLEALDQLYTTVLENAFCKHNTKQIEQRLLTVLGLLVVTRDSLSCTAVATLLGYKRATDVLVTLSSLHSLILVQENLDAPILFHHKSIPDFLTDTTRCTDPRFYVDRDAHHFSTGTACLTFLEQLKKNICFVPRYTLNADIDADQISTHISETMRYCCRYWVDHLLANEELARAQYSGIQLLLLHFLKTRQLQWFEVLGLLKELRYAVESLNRLQTWLSSLDGVNGQYQDTLDWVIDGRKFVLYAFDVIIVSVAHIYHSALPFAPRASLLRKQHCGESEAKVVKGTEASWPKSVRTFEVPGEISTLDYSSDGSMIAVGGESFQHIYRANTGEKIFELNLPPGKSLDESGIPLTEMSSTNPMKRHWLQVRSITFSWDGKTIATASGPEITLWDCTTGVMIGKLPASDLQKDDSYLNQIAKVEFHPTFHHLLLSCDRRGRIFLWDTRTTSVRMICVIGDGGDIRWLKTSHEKKVVIRRSCPGPIELWDVETEPACVARTFEHLPLKFAGSGGGASASEPDDCGHRRHEGAIGGMSIVASSDDGSFVASALDSSSFAVYDASTGDCVESVHLDRYGTIEGLQFLPGVQALVVSCCVYPSAHSFIRVWHPDNKIGGTVLTLTRSCIYCPAISPEGDTIAFTRGGVFVEVYDITTSKNIQPEPRRNHDEERDSSSPTEFHHFSIDGKLFCTSTTSKGEGFTTEAIVQVQHADDGIPCGVFRVPEGFCDAIILKDNSHAITLHVSFVESTTLILWDIRMGTEVARVYAPGECYDAYVLPYTHDDAIGCFCVYNLALDTDHDVGGSRKQYGFECYTFSLPSKSLVTVAQGRLSPGQGRPLRIYHEDRSTKGDITLCLQCSSGEQFSAVWKGAAGVVEYPQKLDLVLEEEREISEPRDSLAESDIGGSDYGRVGSECRCRYSSSQQNESDEYENKVWVYNGQGVPILWVPPTHRIRKGMEHKEAGKLVWAEEDHELILVDISHVHTNSTDKGFGIF